MTFEKDIVTNIFKLVDKDVGTSSYSSLYLEEFELDFPWRRFVPFENTDQSFLNHFPRKQVPSGENHQTSISLWGKIINVNNLDLTKSFISNIENGGMKSEHRPNVCTAKMIGLVMQWLI